MKSQRASSPALRVFHAIVFLGFAAAAIAGTHQELIQLWRVVSQPYNAGTRPIPIACAAGLLAAVLTLVLLACVALGRTVPLAVSGLMLLSFAGSFAVHLEEPKQRSVPGANVKALDRAKELHGKIATVLQLTRVVPTSGQTLRVEGESPFHKRFLTPLPWRVELVPSIEQLPEGAEPGWLLLQASPDAASFAISSVGIDDQGLPSLLRQDGKPVAYRGAFNPDTAR